MVNNKVNAVTDVFVKELEKEDYDSLVIVNPLSNMTVQTINASTSEKMVYSYNEPIDSKALREQLMDLASTADRVKVIYFKRSKRGAKELREVIAEARYTLSSVKVVYIDYEKMLPVTYTSRTFTVNVLDTFGLKHSVEVRDALANLMDKETNTREMILNTTNLSDYINGAIDEYLKKGYYISICNQTSNEVKFNGSTMYAVMEGKVEMDNIYPNLLKSIHHKEDRLTVFIHIVDNGDSYLKIDAKDKFVYEVVLTI